MYCCTNPNHWAEVSSIATDNKMKHQLEDLPPCLRIFHARRKRGIQVAAKRESSKGYYVMPPAFQSSLEHQAVKQSILQQVVANISDQKNNINYDDDMRSNTIQRIRRRLSRKRTSWQQMALRGRHEAHHHSLTLKLLKDAVKRAKVMEDATRSFDLSDEIVVPVEALLDQVPETRTPIRSNRPVGSSLQAFHTLGENVAFNATSSSGPSEERPVPVGALLERVGQRRRPQESTHMTCLSSPPCHVPPVENALLNIGRATGVVKVQALYRGYFLRRSLEKKHQVDAPTIRQQFALCSDWRLSKLERQTSEITMSDFGDSTQHIRLGYSSLHTCVSISEREESDSKVNDEEFLNVASAKWKNSSETTRSSGVATANNEESNTVYSDDTDSFSTLARIDKSHRTGMFQPNEESINLLPNTPHSRWKDRQTTDTTSPILPAESEQHGHDPTTSEVSHTSLSRCFGREEPPALVNLNVNFPILVAPHKVNSSLVTTTCRKSQSNLERQGLAGVDTLDEDDEVSLTGPFLEVKMRADNDSLQVLHRSEGSWDFFRTLKPESTSFKDNASSPAYVDVSLGLSSSITSRWEAGTLGSPFLDPLKPEQVVGSKAAVRPPSRKPSPSTFEIENEASYDNRMSSIASSNESVQPSPRQLSRKASSHGTFHVTDDLNIECSAKLSIQPIRRLTPKNSNSLAASFPPLPIRKPSKQISFHGKPEDCFLTASTPHNHLIQNRNIIERTNVSILEDNPIRKPERKVWLSFDSTTMLKCTSMAPCRAIHGTTTFNNSSLQLPERKLSVLHLGSTHTTTSNKLPSGGVDYESCHKITNVLSSLSLWPSIVDHSNGLLVDDTEVQSTCKDQQQGGCCFQSPIISEQLSLTTKIKPSYPSEKATFSKESSPSLVCSPSTMQTFNNGLPRSPVQVVEQLVAARAEMAKQRRMKLLLEQATLHLVRSETQ